MVAVLSEWFSTWDTRLLSSSGAVVIRLCGMFRSVSVCMLDTIPKCWTAFDSRKLEDARGGRLDYIK